MWHRDERRARARRGSAQTASLPTALVTLVVLAASGACGLPADGSRRGELRGEVTDPPIPKPQLVLSDTRGRRYDLREETDGYLTLVFFGYTHCPDVCPVHMAILSAAMGELSPEVRDRIKVVFVSTDPEGDSPERLRAWLDAFSPSIVGLRGPVDEINTALASMKLPGVAVIPAEQGQYPMIGHPAAVLAFGPDGLARVRYPFGIRRADWVHDLLLLTASP